MPRDHTRVNLGIWGDDEFLELPVDAQNLYWRLWTSPERSYCGSHEWRPGKLVPSAGDWTIDRILAAGAILSERLFLIIDETTEECLLRSWIKHDGLWRTPNMAVSMANARAALGSKTLRGVIVWEVKKLAAAEPDQGGWKRDEVRNMLNQKAINPASLEPFNPGPKGGINPSVNPPPNPPVKGYDANGINPPVNPPLTTATATYYELQLQKKGCVSGEPHLEPPSRCPSHLNHPKPPKCHDCADARRAHEAWAADQLRQKRTERDARAKAITDCLECDPDGWAPDEDGAPTIRCSHPKLAEVRHA